MLFLQWLLFARNLRRSKKILPKSCSLSTSCVFQAEEIKAANLQPNEDIELEEEKRRLNNVEKLTALSGDAFSLLYDNAESTAATLEKAERKITELSEYES